MTLKKILGILLVICMVLGFAACGVKSSDNEDKKGSSKETSNKSGGLFSNDSSSSDESVSDDESDNSSDSSSSDESGNTDNGLFGNDSSDSGNTDEDSGSGLDVSGGSDVLTSMDLPEGYPKHDYPIIDGAVITFGMQNEENNKKQFSVSATVEKPAKDVADYYKKLVSSAENKQSSTFNDIYSMTGTFKGYEYQFVIGADQSNKESTAIVIVLQEVSSD